MNKQKGPVRRRGIASSSMQKRSRPSLIFIQFSTEIKSKVCGNPAAKANFLHLLTHLLVRAVLSLSANINSNTSPAEAQFILGFEW
jgi:hypothetical protein